MYFCVPCPFGSLRTRNPTRSRPLRPGGRQHAADNRIGADRHAADRLKVDSREQFEQAFAHQLQPFGVQRDLLAVEVVAGLLSGGQREFAELEGPLAKELDESIAFCMSQQAHGLQCVGLPYFWILTSEPMTRKS